MGVLDRETAIFDRLQRELEAKHYMKWVVIHDQEFVGAFESFQTAAEVAVSRFGRGPYLIKQVGAPPMTLPASVLYRPVDADD